MSHVYGDSTPFPYDLGYIDWLRGAVDCSVQLFSAQHAIDTARERCKLARESRLNDQDQLHEVECSVQSALRDSAESPCPSVVHVASQILRDTGTCVQEEVHDLHADSLNEAAHNEQIAASARETACRAMESLVVEHDIPETGLCLSLNAAGRGYAAQVVMTTPFGIRARCEITPPANHAWLHPRRVNSLCPQTTVDLPCSVGWRNKRSVVAPTRLDRLFVTDVTFDETHTQLSLRKTPGGGSGYRFWLAYEPDPRAIVSRIDSDGQLDPDSTLTLEGQDNHRVLRLMRRIGESTRDLVHFRKTANCIVFNDEPLVAVDEPGQVARRIIATLAPIARETALRSGAPGELVVRHSLGDGRREESYIRTEELLERTLVLPPDLQAEFDQLGITSSLPPDTLDLSCATV